MLGPRYVAKCLSQLLEASHRVKLFAVMLEPENTPTKKRHGMLFRRRSPSETNTIAPSSDMRSGRFSQNNVSIAGSHASTSKSDPLSYAGTWPPPPPRHLERAQSSEYFLEIHRSQPAGE